MDVVVDTSAIIAAIADEPNKQVLVERTEGATLLAPKSVYWEIGNAFSAMVKRNRITLADAHAAVRVFHTIPIRWLDIELGTALALAARLGICAYDAYVIGSAQQRSCSVLTLDRGLTRAAKSAGVPVLEIET